MKKNILLTLLCLFTQFGFSQTIPTSELIKTNESVISTIGKMNKTITGLFALSNKVNSLGNIGADYLLKQIYAPSNGYFYIYSSGVNKAGIYIDSINDMPRWIINSNNTIKIYNLASTIDTMTSTIYDINTNNVVDNSEKLNNQYATYYATATDLFDISNKTTILSNMVDRPYPIFEFDLIYYDPVTRDFVIGTELELKASINNFITATTNGHDFAYWGDTLYAGEPGYLNFTNSDAGMRVYYSDYTNSNARIMKTYVSSSISNKLTDAIGVDGYVTTVLVSPSRTNHNGQAYSWMTEYNTNVVWCWRPRGAVDEGPKTSDGKMIWYPCRPKEWASAPLNY
jgi:hypothetical protein